MEDGWVKLAAIWHWSTTKLKKFLELLAKEDMITYTCDNKKTSITLVNYGVYQDSDADENKTKVKEKNTESNPKVNQKNTNKKDKEGYKKEKNIDVVSFAEFVTMTNAEYERLVSTYGEGDCRRMIQILDNYKGSTGKKYKSDYRAILNWVAAKVVGEKKVISMPNAGAYKKEIEKCPKCGDTGWILLETL